MRSMSRILLLLFLAVPFGLFAEPVSKQSLDLTEWDRKSSVSLDGDWAFWPRSLPSGEGKLLKVPGSWNSLMGSADGWGSYQLTVHFPEPAPRDLALYVTMINSASEVLWNGATVWKTGVWAPTVAQFTPDRRTGVVSLETKPGDNLLEIRVSSWGDFNAGLTEPLHLGTLTGLINERNTDIISTVFIFGCLLIMGVYHLGLFAFRPQDWGALWFGLLSIFLGLRGLLFGPSYIADLLPTVNWEIMMKIGYLTFSAPTLLLGLFIRETFPQQTPRWFLPVLLVGAGGYGAMNLLLPAAWYSPSLPWFQAYVGVTAVIVCWILGRAIWNKELGSGLFLAGFLLFFATVVNDILKTNLFIPTPYLSPIGLVAFLIFQSLVMLRKFTAAFADSERYARHLARLNTSLERFIPKEVLSFLQKESIVEIELGDHCEQPMSVMFVDIRDFTTLSETMTPQENFKFINSYLRRMGPVVRRHNGFVDKYMGDGIMALFPGPAQDAIDAALAVRAALVEYNHHRVKSGYPAIRVGVGVHRGPLMLGTIGENQRMDSTVISDTVNAASRLEGLTKKFGCDILISGETVEALGLDAASGYKLEYLDEETVKGRKRPLKVYLLSPLV